MTSTLLLLKKLLKGYVQEHWRVLLLGCLCMVVVAITTAVLATYLKPIFDDIFIGHRRDMLFYTAFGILGIFFIKGAAEYGSSLSMEYVGQKIMISVQENLFAHLIFLDFDFFQKRHGAELLSIVTNDVRVLRNCFIQSLSNIVKDGITVVSLLVVMLQENLRLSAVALIGFPLALLPLIYCGRRVRRLSGNVQQQVALQQVFFQQIFHSISLIKSSHTEAAEVAALHTRLSSFFKESMKTFTTRALVHPIMEILGGVAIAIVILNGGMQVMQGTQTTGSFLTFLTALLFIYRPAKNIVHFNTLLQEGLAAAERIFAVYQRPKSTITVPLIPEKSINTPSVTFDHVTFMYPDTDRNVLEGLSCTFPAGKRSAIVGTSGAGKTTLFYLLLRFYEPHSGRIVINGEDISLLSLYALRKRIALVSQNIFLFDDTIMNNIRYGCPEVTEQEAYEAARCAYADTFIKELPKGYETIIGENGTRLSGGQKQRIALARAFVRKAPLLLLDEATSALDAESEQCIQQALEVLIKGRTTLIIAHRFSTIESCDSIFVMQKGRLVEQGTHQELMAHQGVYARLALLQELTA